jgi:hypothetical protein
MHTATVPTCVRSLASLAAILEKASAYARERKIDAKTLLGTRLFPDMFPLAMQLHVANDIAQSGATRLVGGEVKALEAKERDFEEWIATTRKTIAYLEALKPEQFQGSEDRTVTWQTRSSTKNMQGAPYLFQHVLPNVFFHVTTAYDILRHLGVPVGKRDFLGANPVKA